MTEATPAPATLSSGRLANKTAIITGGGSGIGRAAAQRFAAEGARVVVADLDLEHAQKTRELIDGEAVALHVDVSDRHAVSSMVNDAVQAYGQIDVLFSNAGVPEAIKPFDEITDGEWERVMAVNLKGFFLCAQAAAPVMRQQGGGSLIVTGSISARRPRPGMAAYVASKSGVIGLARALAIELAHDRIRVNVINPGPAHTPMLREFKLVGEDDDAELGLGSQLPLGSLIEPSDIAAAAVYLASDESSNVTGLVLNVDGGRDL